MNLDNVIKKNHIFNNIVLASRSHIIKISLRLDMAIIWVNIWNVQSNSKAKGLINRCFNIESYITTVKDANMNPDISQCKNCWKWGHTIFSYRFQKAKYIKCNSFHKSEHHCQYTWYCKVNEKANPPRLEIKKGEPCSHSFKCSNYWGMSRSLTVDFIFFSFLFSLYFIFLFFSIFLFLEQLGLGSISHTVTSVTNWWRSHKTDHGTWKNEVEDSGTKWRHTVWTTHAGLMLYSWSFRVECTVASTDHGY